MPKPQRLFTASEQVDIGSLFVTAHDEDVIKTAEIVMGPINAAMDQVRTTMASQGYVPGGEISLIVTFDCKGEKA